MHISKTYIGINSIDHELHFCGKYGARGEKRAERRKPTPEEMRRINQRNRERKLWHVLTANFHPNDMWVTLKYPAGTRKPYADIRKDFTKFTRRMKSEYKKRGEEFKYIARLEVGKQGGAHVHLIMNRILWADILIQKNWVTELCHIEPCYADGDMKQLASYLAKELPQEEAKEKSQLQSLPEEEKKQFARFTRSRNLKEPEAEVKKYSRRTVKKLIDKGPVAREGYYIDKDSVKIGVNPHTGYSYMYYTEIRLKPIMRVIKIPPGNPEDYLVSGRRY